MFLFRIVSLLSEVVMWFFNNLGLLKVVVLFFSIQVLPFSCHTYIPYCRRIKPGDRGRDGVTGDIKKKMSRMSALFVVVATVNYFLEHKLRTSSPAGWSGVGDWSRTARLLQNVDLELRAPGSALRLTSLSREQGWGWGQWCLSSFEWEKLLGWSRERCSIS